MSEQTNHAEPVLDRTFVRALISEAEAKRFGYCAYCGRPTFGPACEQHRDLLRLERSWTC